MASISTLTGPLVLARTRAPDLESVRKLNCWASDVEDISIVREMPNLEVCSVSVNYITTLKDFSNCSNLQELYIRNNRIENLWEVCYLKELSHLRILWLADNQCATEDNYRYTVLRNLPNLQKLDNIVVLDEEKETALTEGEELSLPAPPPEAVTVTNGEDITPPTEPVNPKPSTNDIKPGTLSWEETNRIRENLGLKPLPIDKITSPKSAPTSATRTRNANILQSVLLLIKELDRDSLEVVDTAVKRRLDVL